MNDFEYYIAPPDSIFNDIKENAIKIWSTYDNTYGYADEKINKIKDLQNISDNAWYMVGMFDLYNQAKLLAMVKPKTASLIKQAIIG